jgi:hypothetical protein
MSLQHRRNKTKCYEENITFFALYVKFNRSESPMCRMATIYPPTTYHAMTCLLGRGQNNHSGLVEVHLSKLSEVAKNQNSHEDGEHNSGKLWTYTHRHAKHDCFQL